jgi:ribonucleoside-triphosphate reductase
MDISQSILSDLTVYMKYAKYNPSLNRRETWTELVDRNKGMHLKKFPNLAEEIEKAYEFVYSKKILPSMRSMQFAGKPVEINNTRVFNCSYLPIDDIAAFSETIFLLLSGCGVGYSVQQHHVEKLPEVRKPVKGKRFLVGDSIEGWADAVKALMKAYLKGGALPKFDFRDIRPKGAQLITIGGKAPGPEPLKIALTHVQAILDRKKDGERLTSLECHDIVCHLADAVLSGGIRRAALIALFNLDDEDMLTCKFGNWWEQNPQRGRANNSAVLIRSKIEKDVFLELWKKIELSNSGEPGFLFSNDKDAGTNPCAEINLKPNQFCNLCEVNASTIESQEDLNERVKMAAFIGTLQASYTDFHYLRDIWKKTTEKEALLGIGMTGIASGEVLKYNLKEAAKIATEENVRMAEVLGINKAARVTCVKP